MSKFTIDKVAFLCELHQCSIVELAQAAQKSIPLDIGKSPTVSANYDPASTDQVLGFQTYEFDQN